MNRLQWTFRMINANLQLDLTLYLLSKIHYKTPEIIETIENYLEVNEKITQGFKITDSGLIVIP